MKHEDAAKTLLEFKKILDDANVKFWLTCGTLLGAVRNGDFIPYDGDIDLMILARDWNPEILLKLKSANFCPIHRRMDMVKMIKRKTSIDLCIYYYYSPADAFVFPRKCHEPRKREIPRDWLETEIFLEFLGKKFRIPYKTEELLASMYGDTWRIPQRTEDGWKETRTFQPISKRILLEWFAEHPEETIQENRSEA